MCHYSMLMTFGVQQKVLSVIGDSCMLVEDSMYSTIS